MTAAVRESVPVALVGLGFGGALSLSGFSSWDEVHAMFTFSDLRLTLGFAVAVVLLGAAWIALARATGARWSPRALHPGTVPGALLFGAGWAISGACPSIALVQLGEGQLGALATVAGIVLGNWVYARTHERWFRWSAATCRDV
jgi:uncharacterized membrane protein YedE/YeeE